MGFFWSKEKKEIAFTESSKKKKAHYKKYPSLADCAESVQASKNQSSPINKMTRELLTKKPSGDIEKRDTLLHVLHGLSAQSGKDCFFYDSSRDILPESKHDEDSHLHAADESGGCSLVLSLESLDGLVDDDEKHDERQKLMELKDSIVNGTSHPVIEDVRRRLAVVHSVDMERVVICDVFAGTSNFKYFVTDLNRDEKERLIQDSGSKTEAKMKEMFSEFNGLKLHPALFHNTYDISMFDERGNKVFDEAQEFEVGPPGNKKKYIQPKGWSRYGLKVLGKYPDDKWLAPFGDDGNWYRSFHGTGREAGPSIYRDGFWVSDGNPSAGGTGTRALYGAGVYSSPDIKIATGYSKSVQIDTVNGTKKFHYVLMVAVNPENMNTTSYKDCPKDYYLAPTADDIRPYGILLKEE